MKATIKILRPKQWSKNLLIFIIPLLSDTLKFKEISLYITYFLTLSLFISGTYIMNDLIDLESDKNHPIKKYRPIASGKITKEIAKKLSFILLLGSFLFSISLESIFTFFLLMYLLLTLLYSFYFKFIKYFDLVYLTTFFIHRILFGAFLFDAEITFIFILFTFFSTGTISIAKKYSIMNTVEIEDSKIKTSLNENYKKKTLFKIFLIFLISTYTIFVIWIFSKNYIYNPSIFIKISLVVFLTIILFYFYKFTETFETEDIIELVLIKRQLHVSLSLFVLLFLYGLSQTN